MRSAARVSASLANGAGAFDERAVRGGHSPNGAAAPRA
jgi:hypothetical protein